MPIGAVRGKSTRTWLPACGLLLIAAGPGLAQAAETAEVDPHVLLLARTKLKMEENLERLPNYTCVQTIERSRRQAPSRRFQLIDTLRLEVALVEGKEMFSWPGASEFREQDLREIVPTGAIGNGTFALHARSVFLGAWPKFQYAGEEELDGRLCIRFDYQVPLIGSGWRLKVGEAQAIVGYHGSFWADKQTLDVVRLDVHADDIPTHLMLQSVSEQMEYRRTRIGAGDFLLPWRAVMTLVDLDGSVSRNETHFSDCRQYVGESFLSFAEPPPVEAEPAARAPAPIEVPGGLRLPIQLQTAIDERTTAVGDRITALVSSNVKRKKEVVVPKGAVVSGRIVHLEKVGGRVPYFVVALQLESIEFGGRRGTLSAELEDLGSYLPYGGLTMTPLFPGAVVRPRPELERLPGVGVFYVKGGMIRLRPGVRMIWRTQPKGNGQAQ